MLSVIIRKSLGPIVLIVSFCIAALPGGVGIGSTGVTGISGKIRRLCLQLCEYTDAALPVLERMPFLYVHNQIPYQSVNDNPRTVLLTVSA